MTIKRACALQVGDMIDGVSISNIYTADSGNRAVYLDDGTNIVFRADELLKVDDTYQFEFRGNRFNIVTIGTIVSEDGDTYTHYYRVEFDPETDEEWIQAGFWHAEFEVEHFPATHCQHEYDCCGHFYANTGYVGVVGYEVIVHQTWSRNI